MSLNTLNFFDVGRWKHINVMNGRPRLAEKNKCSINVIGTEQLYGPKYTDAHMATFIGVKLAPVVVELSSNAV